VDYSNGGALTLSGTNTYTGAGNINSGASLVAGSAKALGALAPALTFNINFGSVLVFLMVSH
jgi:hypothetical protein